MIAIACHFGTVAEGRIMVPDGVPIDEYDLAGSIAAKVLTSR